jgi:hypothetical protein
MGNQATAINKLEETGERVKEQPVIVFCERMVS